MGLSKTSFFRFIILLNLAFTLASCSSSEPSISVSPSTDDFTQEGKEITVKMDILWVIDDSGSMESYQEQLKANFPSFIEQFAGKGYDYRMAVISTGAWLTGHSSRNYADFSHSFSGGVQYYSSQFLDGAVGAPLIERSGYRMISSDDTSIDFSLTPDGEDSDSSDDVEEIFKKNVALGIEGTGLEAGLESIRAALNNPTNAQYGFPRQDAHLAIIMISDEEDDYYKSPSSGIEYNYVQATYAEPNPQPYKITNVANTQVTPVEEFHNFYAEKASKEYGYSFHTIAIFDEECKNASEFAEALITQRYAAVSDLSGGLKASICSDFGQTLQDIAVTIIEKTVEFKLNETPSPLSALQVSIKNPGEAEYSQIVRSTDNGWAYNEERNSIVFYGESIPEAGASIKIFYDKDKL